MGARSNGESTRCAARVAVVVLAGLAPALPGIDALAASDTTFSGPLDTVTDMVAGTGGQLAAALAVGAALVGSVLRLPRAASPSRRLPALRLPGFPQARTRGSSPGRATPAPRPERPRAVPRLPA